MEGWSCRACGAAVLAAWQHCCKDTCLTPLPHPPPAPHTAWRQCVHSSTVQFIVCSAAVCSVLYHCTYFVLQPFPIPHLRCLDCTCPYCPSPLTPTHLIQHSLFPVRFCIVQQPPAIFSCLLHYTRRQMHPPFHSTASKHSP